MGGVADDRTPLVGDVQKESDGPKGEHVNRTGKHSPQIHQA